MILLALLLVIGSVQINRAYNVNLSDNVNSTDYHWEYVLLDESNPCARKCVQNEPPMICRYYFKLEWYDTLSKACYDCPFNTTDCYRQDCVPGDGNKRGVVAINRQIPGPAIEVCKGDIIIADVTNSMGGEGTTIHWHGMHQKDAPYMDGVPYVTQCPILPVNAFRYSFTAVQSGTHFWHSHIGMQRADGAFGALIIREPDDENPHAQFYDYDLSSHVLILLDWEQETALEKFLGHHHNDEDNKPSTILVNGFGRYKEFDAGNNQTIYTPNARFTVEQGYRYRFRVINAGFLNCPIEVSVDNHTLTAISSDGNDFAPVEVTSIVTYAGERFDFILNANQEKGLYWMRFRGLMDCDERFTRAHQEAVLEYKGLNATMDDYPADTTDYDSSHREGIQLNALNRGTESNATLYITLPQLESLEQWDTSLKSTPDFQYYIGYDFYKIDNSHFHRAPYYGFFNVTNEQQRVLTPQFNHISMKLPSFPLLPQRNEITENMFCNNDTMASSNCVEEYCECYHGLTIPLDSVVELIFVDEGFAYDANHPIHLHGYAFRVVAMERLGQNVTVDEVKRRDKLGLLKRNLLDAPLKDTVTVPDGGYTIVRFVASNPGFWILHCHIEFHAEIGMALVLKVGEDNDMLPVPKNFPACGDYLPEPSIDPEKCVKSNNFISRVENLFGEDNCPGEASIITATKYVTLLLISFLLLLR